MSEKNTKKESKVDTPIGNPDNLTIEQKVENLAKNLFFTMEKQKDLGMALDNVYIQVATLIEILAEDEKILNPTIWETKLKEVTKNIQDTMEAMANEAGTDKTNNGKNSDGTDETTGSGKIIIPDNKIIIPGQ